MPSIGPSLPPHLAKRKRDDDGDESSSSSSPPPKNDRDSRSATPDAAEKRRRVVGPAPPPAPLDELPPSAPAAAAADDGSDSSSSDDDDFGPAPPTAADAARAATRATDDEWRAVRPPADDEKPKKAQQRDEWMMVPPKQDDLAARMDPTKLRARGFQTGKGAKAPNHGGGGGDMGAWTETPEQKRKRLEDEVMGRAAPGGSGAGAGERDVRRKVDEETAARVRRYEEKRRGESLYEKHRERVGAEKDDDPSKRAFDYAKDMGGGMRIDGSKRKEMIRKAGDFGSKFSGGKFL
ncbi:nopp 140 functions as a transcriptional activator [Neofusicoccum parvum]|uniref:Nopp 140 functions as a transcriptional activator n=1 Tax=Neofusicoccum parvum TaxID=310453 RepID=A0ACB5RPG2_9PEZI|nr:nopp 140 functions as a transcriptional activator [Neofusicoccum parvum]GME64646.1 nopp 140 functions as a transcriptional activator [Neofusicoccum parvum]